ncbi:MerR family transcriptional regulator [Paenibacillus sp. JCM 10914]|uniref:MerR family transcriptional regulator n=1 Tax=Paenibacillus sp. JCM 10914 TaxID=1236974 RepID=UPI0003CC4111|nr:MerR family transcriptional regulator [Paenibacillus sp. JCM 10914]GAE08597.1 transcriptional regulator, MerR family [Paenibacillus sp. JCM 10914]
MGYLTAQIAGRARLHPNTVRLYEEWGYISPVPRADNGYRLYSDLHLYQLRIARTAFRCEIVQGHIRAMAREIVEASGQEKFTLALELAVQYLGRLQQEHMRALEVIDLVEQWLSGTEEVSTQTYSLKEAASQLEVSTEILRNWERNGLLSVPRHDNGYRAYTDREMNRLKMIRTLRSAHYSTSAILRLFNKYEQTKELDVRHILNTPDEHEDIIALTDRLTNSLEEGIEAAHELINLLNDHGNLKRTNA